MNVTATFDGGAVSRALRSLAERITPQLVAEALEEALEPMRAQAQANLEAVSRGTYSTGQTAASGVQLQVAQSDDGETVSAKVGLRRTGKSGRAYIGNWLEFGVPARGLYARAWLRPAWDSTRKGVTGIFAHALRKRLGV